jgi:hypothetical protein
MSEPLVNIVADKEMIVYGDPEKGETLKVGHLDDKERWWLSKEAIGHILRDRITNKMLDGKGVRIEITVTELE